MENLKNSMDPEEYRNYTRQAMFVVRRSDKPFSGILTDMTIEQTLNRFFGTDLVHGRGVTPSVISRYLGAMPTAFTVMEGLENYIGLKSSSSEQHQDLHKGRIKKDHEALRKFVTWLRNHKPFDESEVLKSLSTNVIGTKQIDCHKAVSKGKAGVISMIGKSPGTIKLNSKYEVENLNAAKSTLHHPEDFQSVDTTLLFQKIFFSSYGDIKLLKEASKFELAPFPMSLFNTKGFMNDPSKSDLYSAIGDSDCNITNISNFGIVIDGGFLVHQTNWGHGKTFLAICEGYLDWIKKKYSGPFKDERICVVFDGYDNEYMGVKSYERYRRQQKNVAPDFDINLETICSCTKDQFLSNVCNKQHFVRLLADYLLQESVQVEQAVEDADTVIIQTALEMKKDIPQPVAVVGNDTDLMVLLIAQIPIDENEIYFHKLTANKKVI